MAVRPPSPQRVTQDVERALEEDIGPGDLTANLIPEEEQLKTRVISREQAVLCGRPWFDAVFEQIPGRVTVDWKAHDGELLEPDQTVCTLVGSARNILTGERAALNFLQTLSGTATQTRAFINELGARPARLLDTRKTLPGLRFAQKYAVLCGGGSNHRMGLFDAILIKENHISAAGGISRAIRAARDINKSSMVEIEVESLDELAAACAAGADRALLDNFTLKELKLAVAQYGGKLELEASGDVRLATVAQIADTGVDFISTGAITKHLKAVDFSMRFENQI